MILRTEFDENPAQERFNAALEKNDNSLYYTSHFGSLRFGIASTATQSFDTTTDAVGECDFRCKRIYVLRRAACGAKNASTASITVVQSDQADGGPGVSDC